MGGWEFVSLDKKVTKAITLGDAEFSVVLGLETNGTDSDSDTLPHWWERANRLDPTDDGSTDVDNGSDGDPDGDGLKNATDFCDSRIDPAVPCWERC